MSQFGQPYPITFVQEKMTTKKMLTVERIKRLKTKKNAVILAHFYQSSEVQEIADFVGDSLALSQQAAITKADIIVFAGVHFMAETAKIINPGKKVLLPDLTAGCSLADSCPPHEFEAFIKQHPNHKVITYINSSAAVKAMSDIICTSSNAIAIVNSVPLSEKIIFAPDKQLGKFVAKATGRDMVLWDGACHVHTAFSLDKIAVLKQKYPNAQLIAHPESAETILEMATYVGSTSNMINHIVKSEHQTFIVATEIGILHKLRTMTPNKILVPAPISENNSCACSECEYMKRNTLDKLLHCLEHETNTIEVNETLRKRALIPIERMLHISSKAFYA